MSRRNAAVKREIAPDSRYNNAVMAKFINCVMKDGKKAVAINVVYKALELVANKTKEEPLTVFLRAINNVHPLVEVKSKRVGGATYQVPMQVAEGRAQALAFRWTIEAARKRSEKDMHNKLAGEIVDAAGEAVGDADAGLVSKGAKGGAMKKKEDAHKMAEANKAFSHLNR